MAVFTNFQNQESFSDSNLIKKAIDSSFLKLNTLLPCKIVSLNQPGFYNIQPLINNLDVQNNPITPNIIYDVPTAFEINTYLTIQHNYAVNDVVLVGFCQRNIDNIKNNQWKIGNPANLRIMNLNDAVIIRGLYSANTSKVSIIVDNDGTITINSNKDTVINSENTEINTTNADIKADKINLGKSSLEKILLESTQFKVTVTGVQNGGGTAFGTAEVISGTASNSVKAAK